MAFTVTVTPQLMAETDLLTPGKVNAAATPTVACTGAISGASDVAISSPTAGQTLVYNATTSKWNNSDSGVINQTFRNLLIYPNGAAPTTRIDITADNIILSGTNNVSYNARSFTATINSANVGVINGLDTGTLDTGWYYVWAISNGTTVAGLLSLSDNQTDVLTPGIAGYTYRARLGAVYAAAGVIRRFYTVDHETVQDEVALSSFTKSATFVVLATTELASFKTAIPPKATEAWGIVGTTTDHPCQVAIGMAASDGVTVLDPPPGLCVCAAAAAHSAGAAGTQFLAKWYGAAPWRCKLWSGTSVSDIHNISYRMRDTTPTYGLSICGYTI